MNTELQTIESNASLIVGDVSYTLTNPEHLFKFSGILKDFITKSQLSTVIQGNKYANVDAWKFAGLNFGLIPLPSEPVERHKTGDTVTILYRENVVRHSSGQKRITQPFFASTNERLSDQYRERFKDIITRDFVTDYYNYKCGCEIVNTQNNAIVGRGFGVCSNLELAKVSFDEFAVMSMSQTRAIGRGFKNNIGFIMKAAGFQPTPSEEMDMVDKQVAIDDSTMLDIESAIVGCASIEELVKTWDGLSAQVQSHRGILSKFKKRKAELQSKKKNEATEKNI